MSYTNPQIFFADPTALQKGFNAGFSSMQDKFEKERLEKERIAKEQEDALKEAYNSSDLSDVANLDTKIMTGLQRSIDSIIEKGQFATASASEQAKMLRQVSAVKNTIQRLGDLAAMPQEDWDTRNSAKISALKSALTKGDNSIEIVGDGLDLKIVGDFGEVTLDELSATKFMDKTGFDDEYQDLTTKFIESAEKHYAVAAKQGVKLDREEFRSMFANIIKNEGDPELWSYLYSNQMDSKKMEGRFYGDPETKKVAGENYEDRQFNTMIDDLFEKVIGSAYTSEALIGVGLEERRNKQRELAIREGNLQKTSDKTKLAKGLAESIVSNLNQLRNTGFLFDIPRQAAQGQDYKQTIDTFLANKLTGFDFNTQSVLRDENTGEIIGFETEIKHASGSPLPNEKINVTFSGGTTNEEIRQLLINKLEGQLQKLSAFGIQTSLDKLEVPISGGGRLDSLGIN